MNHLPDAEDLKTQMVNEAILILASVSFLEHQISRNCELFDLALERGDDAEADKLELQRLHLLKKIRQENNLMDEFMEKYQPHPYETQAILSGVK